MAKRIVMLDCQSMFVEGLESYLALSKSKFKMVAQVCSSEELHKTVHDIDFDVLITELNIPDQDGLQIIEEVRSLFPDLHILVLSAYTDFKFVKNAMVKGADGYVSKSSNFSELSFALEEIFLGNTYIGDGLRTSPAASDRSKVAAPTRSGYQDSFTLKNKLTKRESEILELITLGMSNKIIASKLYISDQTVGVHRKNIMKKLQTRNTASLIKFALENHLV